MNPFAEAERLTDLGNELSAADRKDDAEGAYQAAAKACPDWWIPWYDLGLLYKYQGRWTESFAMNQRAVELEGADQGAWWNLGIAATALGDWTEARRAWRGCGLAIPDGEGPPELDFGMVPIRLDPDGAGEVVWSQRIDPARARIASVPLPTSMFRWGDLVLHDGAPEGHRMLRESKVPVFNALGRLEVSIHVTFVVELGTSDPAAIDALERIAADQGGAAENWGTSTNILCRECSLGLPHYHPGQPTSPAHPHCGVAARDEISLQAILDAWLATTPAAAVVRWMPAPGARP